jgi:hypothetical protein
MDKEKKMMEPTQTEQQEFWRLFGAVAQAKAELMKAEREYEHFARKHEGKSFHVFPPELIASAISRETSGWVNLDSVIYTGNDEP